MICSMSLPISCARDGMERPRCGSKQLSRGRRQISLKRQTMMNITAISHSWHDSHNHELTHECVPLTRSTTISMFRFCPRTRRPPSYLTGYLLGGEEMRRGFVHTLPFSLLPQGCFSLFSIHAGVGSSPFEVGSQALDERCWLALRYAQLHIAQGQGM